MSRYTRRKGASKGTYKRSYKRTSKRTSKRIARKQSGGINMKKLKEVVNQRSRSSALAVISAEKAKKFKEQINLL